MPQKYNFLARFQAQDKKKTMKRSRRVMIIKGILYSSAMVMLYISFLFGFIYSNIKNGRGILVFIARLLDSTIGPLQGLFNMLIYLVPVFRKRLKTYRQRKGIENESTNVNSIAMNTTQHAELLSQDKVKIIGNW